MDALALAEQVGAYGENLGDFGFGSSLAGSVYSGLSPADQSAADNLLAIQAEQQRLQQQAIQAANNWNTMVGQAMSGAPQMTARGDQPPLLQSPTIDLNEPPPTILTPAALPAAAPGGSGFTLSNEVAKNFPQGMNYGPTPTLPPPSTAQSIGAGAAQGVNFLSDITSPFSETPTIVPSRYWGDQYVDLQKNINRKAVDIGQAIPPIASDLYKGYTGGFEHGGVAQGFGNPIVVGDSSENQENQELVMSFGNAPMVVLPLNERQEDIMEQAANVGPPRAQTGGMFGNTNFSTLAQMPSTTSFGGTQFGFGMDRPISQRELIQRSEMYSSPAVRDIFAGQTPQSMRFGFNLFTPGQMQSLTGGEREELRTRLAARNTTLEDVEQQVMRQFGPTGVRRGRRRF